MSTNCSLRPGMRCAIIIIVRDERNRERIDEYGFEPYIN